MGTIQQLAIAGALGASGWTAVQLSVQLAKSVVIPTFATHIQRAKTREASFSISAINQAQQVHFLDHGIFADDLAALELGISSRTPYYQYQLQPPRLQPSRAQRARSGLRRPKSTPATPTSETLPPSLSVSVAIPNQPGLPTYWGAVQGAADGSIADRILCRSQADVGDGEGVPRSRQLLRRLRHPRKRSEIPSPPSDSPDPGSLSCPAGYEALNF